MWRILKLLISILGAYTDAHCPCAHLEFESLKLNLNFTKTKLYLKFSK